MVRVPERPQLLRHTVLVGFFCRDDITFAHLNDGAPDGTPRTYTSFSAAAFEAGRSRVEGGLHFQFSKPGWSRRRPRE